MKLSKDDILNSVEYQWRKHQLVLYFYFWLIISIITIFIPLAIGITNLEYIAVVALSCLGVIIFIFLIFGSFMLYSYSKMRYLLKNYENMQIYEVKLDDISTSYMYRGAVYYTVTINNKKVDTNPIFSSLFLSKHLLNDYNNKTVIGLFDESLNKFYVIRKMN
ncbi:MAG: hypothetical protein MRZ09_07055 [Coprobacillus sp.]|nr:hypothetical protein [Coprobacillus sp.]